MRASLCLWERENPYAHRVLNPLFLPSNPFGFGLSVFPGPSQGLATGALWDAGASKFPHRAGYASLRGPLYARPRFLYELPHLTAGTRAYAAPLDIYGLFPSSQKRWKTVETLNERVQDCFCLVRTAWPLRSTDMS